MKQLVLLLVLCTNLSFSQDKFIDKSIEFLRLVSSNAKNEEIKSLFDKSLNDTYLSNELNKLFFKFDNYSSKIDYSSHLYKIKDSLVVDIIVSSSPENLDLEILILRFLYLNNDLLIDNFIFLESKVSTKKEEEYLIDTFPSKLD
jgi:hypothetical protein